MTEHTDTVSIGAAITDGADRLANCGESARLDAELLVARCIDMPRSYLFAHPEDVLDAAALKRLAMTLERRLLGEPMAYITGSKDFWSLNLMVSPATLVPRPETELLVELALRELPRETVHRVLDLGTGCGAIALAIANERPSCDVTAVDVSPDALAIAKQNVRQLELGNVSCLIGDWTTPVADQRFDVIVSNPPYVASGDAALESLRAEPDVALIAGADGLAAIGVLAKDCISIIEIDGLLLLEHGEDQEHGVADLLSSHGWQQIHCHTDFAGKPRVTTARWPARQQ